ncbi:hypothetical protein EPA93_24745 [Ktedonosporobacter rubrisoli]|uniref:Transcriptional regulator n=1 Tax=Ktedonosporobacter rubrisoli TaxID=2509675 RepID=A0A4P6JTV4_KTERU|nr:metal-sensing transcriptional repressor [Ktedonosporobacter rubrisoli]QBD79017.1 hypothetical protein EPA93_24745 [Ktedonosporobacter rubrisoli]
MHTDCRQGSLQQLSLIREQIIVLRQLITEDAYCPDILHQALLIRKALEQLESFIMEGHMSSCVSAGMREGREEAIIQELLEIYGLIGNR